MRDDDQTELLDGPEERTIPGGRTLVIEGDDMLLVTGTARSTVDRDRDITVGGNWGLEAQEVVVRAGRRLVLEAGGNRLTLDEAGLDIEVTSGTLSIRVGGELQIEADEVRFSSQGETEVTSGGAIKLSGAVIRLN